MKTTILITLVALMSIACAGRRPHVVRPMSSSEVYFGFSKDGLKETEASKLDSNVTYLKEAPNKMIVIEGHTDPIGNKDFNYELGDRRAREVKHYMVTHGVLPQQILVVSFGEENLKDRQRNDLNRRAVIRLTSDTIQGEQK